MDPQLATACAGSHDCTVRPPWTWWGGAGVGEGYIHVWSIDIGSGTGCPDRPEEYSASKLSEIDKVPFPCREGTQNSVIPAPKCPSKEVHPCFREQTEQTVKRVISALCYSWASTRVPNSKSVLCKRLHLKVIKPQNTENGHFKENTIQSSCKSVFLTF